MASKKMSPDELKTILSAEKATASAVLNSAELAGERSDAMDYYYGRMEKDMPSAEGRSKAVSTDVADTIEGLMPALMDIFCGSDEVVRFEPVGPEDEEAAQQETDYVNYVFMQQNPGFLTLYSFIKDALLQKNGIVKIWWEDKDNERRETYYDQPDDAFAMLAMQILQSNGDMQIIEHTQKADDQGQVTHDVTVLTTQKVSQARVMPIPPEEFGISKMARSIRDANYCFHEVTTKTESDLIEEGYDADQVKSLDAYIQATNIETISRDSVYESQRVASPAAPNSGSRLVRVTEHYIRLDYENNGKAQLYRVTTGGERGEILRRDGVEDIEPCDMIPFASCTPIPVTHRFWGRSLADAVMDIQRIKTALLRGKLDNLYLHNNPRVEVAESFAGPNTLDDLLVSRPGGIVRTKQPGGLNWQVVPDISGSIYPALEYWDSAREMRTGVTRQGQGIDANALQNQSATAVNQVFTMAQARMKLIARVIAETGVKDIFSLLHALICKHGSKAQTVRLRNKWVQVDPRQWRTRNDMTINVGIGNGGKAEQFAQMMAIANIQKEMLAGGKAHLVDDTKLYNTAEQIVRLSGHKNAQAFFNDPSETNPDGSPKHPPQPPPPDPAMVKVQADIQMKQQELQMKQQEIVAGAEIEKQSDQRKAQIEAVQAQADIETQNRKAEAEMAQAQQKFELERELKILDFQLKREMQMAELEMRREQHQQALQAGVYKAVQTAEAHEHKMEQMRESKSGDSD